MSWTEDDSAVYKQLAAIAVPSRAIQIATMLTLVPYAVDEAFQIVELASGEGLLSACLLQAFPKATLLALDGSDEMRTTTRQRLAEFGERARVDEFDMASSAWYPKLNASDFVVSSLCIHHLDDAEKQILFDAVCTRLSERGAFIIADLVAPQRAEARQLFAETWDASAQAQADSAVAYQHFLDEHWNYYRYPDPIDKPSSLFDQLLWLKSAGFAIVDAFWMEAGHAIYGGYKSTEENGGIKLPFSDALSIVNQVLMEDI